MNLTLREEDRQAVDLLLDGAATAGAMGSQNGAAGVYAVTDASLGERVARTYRLVHLLEALGAEDPPTDLLDRTLNYVEKAASSHDARPCQISDLLASQRPVA